MGASVGSEIGQFAGLEIGLLGPLLGGLWVHLQVILLGQIKLGNWMICGLEIWSIWSSVL